MKKILVLLGCVLSLSSCTLWYTKGNSEISGIQSFDKEMEEKKLKTKADIENQYGAPDNIFTNLDGYETYEYKYVYYGTRFWNVIPIVALIMHSPSVEVDNLFVSFDKDDNIVNHYYIYKDGVYNTKANKFYD